MESVLSAVAGCSLQAAPVIVLVLLIRSRFGLPPRWQYGLWLIPMARLALPGSLAGMFGKLVPGLIPGLGEIGAGPLADLVTGAPGRAGMLFGTSALPAAWPVLVWGAGAAAMAAVIGIRSAVFLMKVRANPQLICERTLDRLERCKARLGIRTPLVVVETTEVSGPVLFGWIRPRILLPRGMAARLGDRDLNAVFCHELSHLRQQDILRQYLGTVLLVLHWFNPLVWAMVHFMGKDRERACDHLAVSGMTAQERNTYGRVLLSLSGPASSALPGFAGIAEPSSDIKRRIQLIAAFKKTSVPRTLALAAGFLLFTLAAFAVGKGTAAAPPDLPGLSRVIVTHLAAGEHAKVVSHFDATMVRALDKEKLKATWEGVIKQAGAFRQILKTRETWEQGYACVYTTCEFAKAKLDIKLVYDDKGRISGMWFRPATDQ